MCVCVTYFERGGLDLNCLVAIEGTEDGRPVKTFTIKLAFVQFAFGAREMFYDRVIKPRKT